MVRVGGRMQEEVDISRQEKTPEARYAFLGNSDSKNRIMDRQCYVPFYVNKKRVVGLMDSGSEITIMHTGLFRRVFADDLTMSPSDISFIRSFSAGEIPILGMKNIHLQPD
jgi:hypothetical protein